VPVSKINDSIQTQVLDLISKAQNATVDGVRTVVETIEGYVPELPTPAVAERLPKPATVVDDAFDFATRLLDSQRRFARELFDAVAPIVSKVSEPAVTTKPKSVSTTKKSA
jgi:hypothetical protein